MTKQKLLSQAAAFALVLTILLATPGMGMQAQAKSRKNIEKDKREAMQHALAHKDYTAWQMTTVEFPHLQMDETQFNWFVDTYYKVQDGDFEQLSLLREIIKKNDTSKGVNDRARIGSWLERQKINRALLENDYETWASYMGNYPEKLEKVTPEIFAKLAQAYQLYRAGDFETAKAIHQSLEL